jgi:hypothetical protein
MLTNKDYLMSDGKVFEIVGRDGQGRLVTVLTDLTEIPEDKPLPKLVEEEVVTEPKRRTRKK